MPGGHWSGQNYAKWPPRISAEAASKFFVAKDLTERATGLEPATSSLGSWHSTN
jgi:hypothetical protein